MLLRAVENKWSMADTARLTRRKVTTLVLIRLQTTVYRTKWMDFFCTLPALYILLTKSTTGRSTLRFTLRSELTYVALFNTSAWTLRNLRSCRIMFWRVSHLNLTMYMTQDAYNRSLFKLPPYGLRLFISQITHKFYSCSISPMSLRLLMARKSTSFDLPLFSQRFCVHNLVLYLLSPQQLPKLKFQSRIIICRSLHLNVTLTTFSPQW